MQQLSFARSRLIPAVLCSSFSRFLLSWDKLESTINLSPHKRWWLQAMGLAIVWFIPVFMSHWENCSSWEAALCLCHPLYYARLPRMPALSRGGFSHPPPRLISRSLFGLVSWEQKKMRICDDRFYSVKKNKYVNWVQSASLKLTSALRQWCFFIICIILYNSFTLVC